MCIRDSFQALESLALQRCLLGMADAGLDFALAIWISDAARQRHHAVVRQNIAIQGIQSGIVDVRRQHALAKVVQDHDPRHAAKPAKGLFMQLDHTRVQEWKASSRTDLRLQPSVRTNSRVRRYLPLSGSRTIGPVP